MKRTFFLVISLLISASIIGCTSDDEDSSRGGNETKGDWPVYSFEEMMDEVDLIAFVTVDEVKDKDQDSVDAKISKLEINDVVYSKNKNTEETIALDQAENFVEPNKSYLLFLNKDGDFYYETDRNSLIQEKDNTYNVKIPDIEGEYDKDQFIERIDFIDKEIFVKLELYSASEGTYLDHFPKIITVSNDGNMHVFTEEMVGSGGRIEMEVGEDAPTIEKEISTKEVKEIKAVIEKNRFFSIPKDVTDYDVMDGGGSRITVYEKGQHRKVGGENSDNKHYNAIEDAIFSHVRDEYAAWKKETEDYLSELNGD